MDPAEQEDLLVVLGEKDLVDPAEGYLLVVLREKEVVDPAEQEDLLVVLDLVDPRSCLGRLFHQMDRGLRNSQPRGYHSRSEISG